MRYRGQLVSVLVTNTEPQNRDDSTGVKQAVAEAQMDGFKLAHFDTARHAVYVVSGLNDAENLSIAQAIEPSVSRHIRDSELAAVDSRVQPKRKLSHA